MPNIIKEEGSAIEWRQEGQPNPQIFFCFSQKSDAVMSCFNAYSKVGKPSWEGPTG